MEELSLLNFPKEIDLINLLLVFIWDQLDLRTEDITHLGEDIINLDLDLMIETIEEIDSN